MKPDYIHRTLNYLILFVTLYVLGHIAATLQPVVATWITSL